LAGGCQQALFHYLAQTTEPGITVPVQLLGVRKAALDGFFAPGIDTLAFRVKTILVNPLLGVLPDMPHDNLDVVSTASALVS